MKRPNQRAGKMAVGCVTALLALGTAAARAAPPRLDPDWPCQSIKTPDLSVAAVWNGPDLTAALQTWSHDQDAADLAGRIAERRVPLEQANAAVRAFAQAAGPARHAKLLALAAGLFQTLDTERGQVVAGLDRFGRRQKQLATEIRAQMQALRAQPQASDATAANLGERLQWETRLFEQRRQAVAAACDVPNRIEQRLYALEQTVQGLLD